VKISIAVTHVLWGYLACTAVACGDDAEAAVPPDNHSAQDPTSSAASMDAAVMGPAKTPNSTRDSGHISNPAGRGVGGSHSPPSIVDQTCHGGGDTPDAGDDACLLCALRECCETQGGFCLTYTGTGADGTCYEINVGGIQECFERRRSDAATVESWYLVAECVDEYRATNPDATSAPFPFGEDIVGDALECMIGSRPPSADDDAGGPDERDLFPKDGFGFQVEHCAEECFPGWH